MSKQLPPTPAVAPLVKQWIEAKNAETGWQEIRRQVEELIGTEYGNFEAIVKGLADGDALTTSVKIGDIIDVTVGFDLKLDTVLVGELIKRRPELLGTLFKIEYKADSRKLCSLLRGPETDLQHEVAEAASFKIKKPGYAKAK